MAYPAYTGWSRGTLPRRFRSISTTITAVVTTPAVEPPVPPNTPPTIPTLSEEQPAPVSAVGIIMQLGAAESDRTISLI